MAKDKPKRSLETRLASFFAGQDSGWYEESVAEDRRHYLKSIGKKDTIVAEQRQVRWQDAQRILKPTIGFLGLVAIRGPIKELQLDEIVEKLPETYIYGPNVSLALGGIHSVLSPFRERRASRQARHAIKSALLSSESTDFGAGKIELFGAPIKPRKIDLLDLARNVKYAEYMMPSSVEVTGHLLVVPSSDAIELGASPNDEDLAKLQILARVGPDYGDIYWQAT